MESEHNPLDDRDEARNLRLIRARFSKTWESEFKDEYYKAQGSEEAFRIILEKAYYYGWLHGLTHVLNMNQSKDGTTSEHEPKSS